MTKWVVDRFEEDFAVMENTENLSIIAYPVACLPEGTKEGSVLKLVLEEAETLTRSKRIEEKFERLKKNRNFK